MNFAKGYKTYAIAAIGVGLGIYDALIPYLHLSPIPSWVFVILGFAGLSAGRAAITNSTQAAVSSVLDQIMGAQATAPVAAPAPVTVNVTTAPAQNAQAPEAEQPTTQPHFATAKNRP